MFRVEVSKFFTNGILTLDVRPDIVEDILALTGRKVFRSFMGERLKGLKISRSEICVLCSRVEKFDA